MSADTAATVLGGIIFFGVVLGIYYFRSIYKKGKKIKFEIVDRE